MKRLAHRLFLGLPDDDRLNKLHKLAMFYVAHRRLPRRDSGLLTDHLYYLRAEPSRDPDLALRRRLTNKLEAKAYVEARLGKDIAPQTIEAWDKPSQIQDQVLPDCIIKPAHGGGGIVHYHQAGPLTADEIALARSWFDLDIYRDHARHPNYKHVRKGVFAEAIVAPPGEIKDYKIFCFHGAKAIQVDTDRFSGHRRRLYTRSWEPLPYAYNYPLAPAEPKPPLLEDMLADADAISRDLGLMRVDFYLTDRVWFGEFGNYPDAGSGRFESPAAERHFSRLLFGE